MQAKNSKIWTILKTIRKYLIILVFIANLIAIALMFMATQAWDYAPSSAAIFSYIGLAFPLIFAANVLFLILWIIVFRWKFIIVQLIAFIVLWTPISTYYPMNATTDNVPDDCIKVMSYNVRGFNWLEGDKARRNPIFDYIDQNDPDIVCFQEFSVGTTRKKNWLISEEEFNNKMKAYPHKSLIRLGHFKNSHKYGIAIYSKFPIKSSKRILFPISNYNGASIHQLDINGKNITLVNCHLESNGITAADKQLYHKFFENKDSETLDKVAHNIHERMGIAFMRREGQIHAIRAELDKQNADGVIVCGDFNDTAMSYTYKTMRGDLIDSYATTGLGPGVTYNENMFWFRIDYIMHSANIESYNATVDNVNYSDHYPIWTYLRVK